MAFKKFTFLLGILILPFSTSALLTEVQAISECHGVADTNTAIPNAFGVPWSVFGNTLFMTAECEKNTVAIKIGNGKNTQYIWNQAYYTKDGKTWEPPITLTGDKTTEDGKWITGTAIGNITVTDAQEKNYFAAYMCEWENDAWKCGCRDAETCSDTGLWSIQTFQEGENAVNPVDTGDNTDDTDRGEDTVNQGEVACIPQTQQGKITYHNRTDTDPVSCSYDLDKIPKFWGAMNQEQYANGAICGACARVTGPKGSVDIEIIDLCPECLKGHIDLSPAAFEKVADLELGNVPVEWEYIPCDKTGPVQILFREGSNANWAQIQIRNAVNPIKSVEYKNEQGNYVSLPRVFYGYFSAENGMGEGPFDFRITDIYGQVVEAENIPLTVTTEFSAGGAFPVCMMPENISEENNEETAENGGTIEEENTEEEVSNTEESTNKDTSSL